MIVMPQHVYQRHFALVGAGLEGDQKAIRVLMADLTEQELRVLVEFWALHSGQHFLRLCHDDHETARSLLTTAALRTAQGLSPRPGPE